MRVSDERDQVTDESSSGAFLRVPCLSLAAPLPLVVLVSSLARLELTLLAREALRAICRHLVPGLLRVTGVLLVQLGSAPMEIGCTMMHASGVLVHVPRGCFRLVRHCSLSTYRALRTACPESGARFGSRGSAA